MSEAISGLADGQTLLVGGFGLSGNPENLITAVHTSGVKNMTLVSNNGGTDQCGLAHCCNPSSGQMIGHMLERTRSLSANSWLVS